MPRQKRLVLLVHGWSVRDPSTYGGLPERLKREAKRHPELELDVRQIWLSEYTSFHNEVTLPDIVRAFQAALEQELGDELKAGRRFACIAHSTGGPVIRAWLQQHYLDKGIYKTPMSHLVMLAPANFGSALVQLGLAKLSRLRSAWFEGVDVGRHCRIRRAISLPSAPVIRAITQAARHPRNASCWRGSTPSRRSCASSLPSTPTRPASGSPDSNAELSDLACSIVMWGGSGGTSGSVIASYTTGRSALSASPPSISPARP